MHARNGVGMTNRFNDEFFFKLYYYNTIGFSLLLQYRIYYHLTFHHNITKLGATKIKEATTLKKKMKKITFFDRREKGRP